jgi:Flp pilus assembly protein TadD
MELTIEQALQQGVAAHKEGKLQEAERLYRAILQSQPAHPDANHNLGLIAVSVNKAEVALPLFKTALEANPKIEQFWLSYIDALIKENKLDNAKQVIQQAEKQGLDQEKLNPLKAQLAPKPQTENANSEKFKKQTKNKKKQKTQKQNFKTRSPSSEELKTLLEQFQTGRYGDAEKLAMSLTQKFPKHQFGWKVLGAVFEKTGRMSESLVANQKSAQLAPQDFAAHSNLGNILKLLSRLDESEASYRKAITLKPESAEIHYNLGVTLRAQGKLDEAEASYRQAIVLKPDFAEAHFNLGVTLQDLGRFEETETSYRKAIALKSDFPQARCNLGILLYKSGRYNLAVEQFELSGTHQSRFYAIQCSYRQDDEAIFYEKYDLLVAQGESNAVIGSLGFCSEFKYGVKKSNPFCNDPLKYVVTTDLNEQYDFENIFIKTARDVLKDSSVSYREQAYLTNGVQTAGNIFALAKVFNTEIESIIHAEIEKYRIHFKDSEEGFIKKWPNSYEIYGWLLCMQSGGKLAPHIHEIGWMTGSIYINVPPKSKTDNGNLVVCLGDQEHVLGVDKNQQNIIDVATGSLCLFPASLHHYTIPFEEKEDRIVLAFDVIPTK